MGAGYINTAEIEIICDSAPFTMVVMQTSYFDQRRVERERARGGRAEARPGALGGSPPPSGRSRGDAASCTLTCLDGPQVFVFVSKGEGCSLTRARGGEGGQRALGVLAGFRRERGARRRAPAVPRDSGAAPATRAAVSLRDCAPRPRHPGALSGAGKRSNRGGQTCGSKFP